MFDISVSIPQVFKVRMEHFTQWATYHGASIYELS